MRSGSSGMEPVADAESHLDDALLAGGERLQEREMGSCAIFRTLRTLETGMSIRFAISSEAGSRPSSWTRATCGWCAPGRRWRG